MLSRYHIGPLRPEPHGPAIARVVAGMTLYLDDGLFWAREGVVRALDAFLRRVQTEQLAWFTTSTLHEWRPVETAHGLRALVDALGSWSGSIRDHARHGFFFEIGDDPPAPETGFYYRESDPSRSDRTSVLEVSLPQDVAPAVLLDLVREIAEIGPYHGGVAGFQARWGWQGKRDAFTQIYVWCSRFWGLDVQDPELFANIASTALPGSGWLTLVGRGLAARAKFDLGALEGLEPEDVFVEPGRYGVIVRAGAAPHDGDVNRLVFADAYTSAARALVALFPEEPPEYWGPFGGREQTKTWMQRFVDVKAWSDREL